MPPVVTLRANLSSICERDSSREVEKKRKVPGFFLYRQRRIPNFRAPFCRDAWQRLGLWRGGVRHPRLDPHWPDISFLGHLATDHKHRDDNHHLPHGIFDSKHPES